MDNFLAIDFETATYARDSACSVGLVRVEKSKIVHKEVRLIRPPTKQFVFTYIHGLTWDDVKDAPTFGELWPEVKYLFDGVDHFVAHNASFDRSVLNACCRRYNVDVPSGPFTCSMKLAREVWSIYPTKLSDVCGHLNIELNHHEALSDALACAKIVLASRAGRSQAKQPQAKPKTIRRKAKVTADIEAN